MSMQHLELPSISSLMREVHQKNNLSQSVNESNRSELHESHVHLGISDPPKVANNIEVGDSFSYRQPMDMENTYSIPSPISPRTTRCPSLTESLYSVASSSTNPSMDSSPIAASSSDDKESVASHMFGGDALHYHHHHHHHQHRITKPYRSPPPRRPSFDLPTPPSRMKKDVKTISNLRKSGGKT
jgi:hypothetical protein